MKFTLSWLKEHLDTDADAATIADKLTSIGLEVEAVEDAGARLKDFVVAYVVSADKHPNADKLKLCMVDIGRADSTASSSEAVGLIQVVCGAPNAHAGMKGVFVRPGAVIPVSGEVLKVGTIRGVESRGMLCSARELLLGDDHDGIIELPADAKIGEPAAKALGLTDPVIDVNLTPNRGDAAGVYGIARDLAAAGLGTLKDGTVAPVPGKFPSPIAVTLDFDAGAKDACPMFSGRLVRGVKNGPSPKWVQDRLKAVGLRPISALVDVDQPAVARSRPSAACFRRRQTDRQCPCTSRARWRKVAGIGRQDLHARRRDDRDRRRCGGAGHRRRDGRRGQRLLGRDRQRLHRICHVRSDPHRAHGGAGSASCRMRATASSAVSILNSSCPVSNSPPSSSSIGAAARRQTSSSPAPCRTGSGPLPSTPPMSRASAASTCRRPRRFRS